MKVPIGSLVNASTLGHLGVGKLHKYDERGRAIVHFGDQGTHTLAQTTPITRTRLSGATPVRFRESGGETAIGEVIEFLIEREDGGFVYRVRAGEEVHDVWEGHIMPFTDTKDPLQLLKAFRWDSPVNFMARWTMVDEYTRWFAASGGFPAMLGARVIPLGHQIYAARRVLFDRVPRFILADEVGLGKTIEAGMIIQALQAERPDLNVLIIAPGSMSRQWLTETYLRFGARAYYHLDCARMSEEGSAPLKAIVRASRMIVSTTALEAYPEIAESLVTRKWDMVVVDEAHQTPPGHILYPLLEKLSRQSDGLLLLSATPSKRDISGLMGLLALVAPEAFAGKSLDILQRKYDLQKAVWDRLNFTRKLIDATAAEGRELDPDEVVFAAEEWRDMIDGDAFLDDLVARMRNGDAGAALELVAYVQEFHRLDHRIIRTRRATLGGNEDAWPVRDFIELDWCPSQAEAIFLHQLEELPSAATSSGQALRALYLRFCSVSSAMALRFLKARQQAIQETRGGNVEDAIGRLAADAGPDDEPILVAYLVKNLPVLEGEQNWLRIALALALAWAEEGGFSRATRLSKWLIEHLADNENQVLVFAQDAEGVDDLADFLEDKFGKLSVARFSRKIDEKDLADTAFRFQHDKKCRILVSDELGGEGRNFQNASAVVHFDVPTSCARLEQRIGRLDRVGRPPDRSVLSVVISPATSTDEALLAVHRDAFRVFTRTIGGLEFVLPSLQRLILAAYGDGVSTLKELKTTLQSEVDAALSATDEAFDLSLDATKPDLVRSSGLAAQIEDSSASQTANTVRFWASRLGIQAKALAGGSNEFRWTNGSLDISGDRLKVGRGTVNESRLICGTFHRDIALTREDLQYFAPGHDFIDATIYEAERGRHSRVTAYLLEGFPQHRGTKLLQVLGRSVLDERLWKDHTISPGLAARARSLLWPEVVSEITLVWDSRGRHHNIVSHGGLRTLLDHPMRGRKLTPLEPGSINSLPYLPQLWSAIDDAVAEALSSIATRRESIAEQRADMLETSLRAECGFLRWRLQTAETPDKADAEHAELSAREALIASLRRPRVDLVGLALVELA
jgi:ATP-dependent helicase HepA